MKRLIATVRAGGVTLYEVGIELDAAVARHHVRHPEVQP